VLVFSVYLIRLYRGKKRAHEIITAQKKLTDHHLEIIAEKQKEIVDSINYAKRIQYALLAHEEMLKKYLPEHFVLFRPKDIVSGDFYWFTHFKDEKREFSYLAVCDSTGHGVPGAFMSLLNISFINESITEKNILEPNLVFNHVRIRLMENLGKDGQNDGFDGILLRLDHHSGKMDYAASNNSPIFINEEETIVLPCDKMPVGKGELSNSFGLFEIPQGKSGILYLPTDGYSDQFGGEKGKKLKFSNMLKYMNEIYKNPLSEQSAILNSKFEKWKGELEQLDDVCIIWIKI
jgi:serine phosphatase RsbU (regulator of sigma subunit)